MKFKEELYINIIFKNVCNLCGCILHHICTLKNVVENRYRQKNPDNFILHVIIFLYVI